MSEELQSLTLDSTFVFQGVLLTPGDLIVFETEGNELRAAFLQMNPKEGLQISKDMRNSSDPHKRYSEDEVSNLRIEVPADQAVPQESKGTLRGQRLRTKTPSTGFVEGIVLAAFQGTVYMWCDSMKTVSKKRLLGESTNAEPETTKGFVNGSIAFFEHLP